MPPTWFAGNRLTPEPDGDRDRTGIVRIDERVRPHVLLGWARQNKRAVFEAMKNKVVIPNDYCLRLHQERIDQQLPKHGDPSWRQGELLALSDTKPAVLVDRNGVVAAWIFPHFLQEQSLNYLNDITDTHAQHEFPKSDRAKGIIKGAKSNGKARAGIDTYTTTHGVWGTVTWAIAWHQQVHNHDRSFGQSKDLESAKTVTQAIQRDRYICAWHDIHWRINDIVSLVHPALHSSLTQLRHTLLDHPSARKWLSIWSSIFPGHSFICNRTTGEHIDRSGLRRGFEAILANGEFLGGDLLLVDLNVSLPLLPGTLVLIDGTSQRHLIMPWHGKQRYSHALFVHKSVLEELNIPHTLPDVSIDEITSRLSRPTAPSTSSNSKSPYSSTDSRRNKRCRTPTPHILPNIRRRT